MATGGPASRLPVERLAGFGGFVYVGLFIAGNLIAFTGAPTGDEAPAKYVAFYSDGGNRDQIALGWLVVLVGIFFFLWFLAALRQFVASVDLSAGFLTTLTTVGGTIYAAMSLAGISLWTGIATMSDDTFRDSVSPALVHGASDAGYVIHSAGGVGAAAMMVAASVAAAGAGLIPRWAGTLGIVLGAFAILSIFFIPQIGIALWILAAGWLISRVDRRSSAAPIISD